MAFNSIADLKKSRGGFDNLMKEVDKIAKPEYSKEDDRFWQPEVDKVGNGYAVIRFLPTSPKDTESDGLPWIKFYDHGFQGPGGWYIEKSLTSIGQDDPLGKYNSELWESGIEANKEQARKQKRRLHYVSNIYVVSDPKNPENEGKVFLFKYGKKIFDKLTKMMNPDLESEESVNPFCLWNGANFKLKMTRQSGFPNYDESTFLAPGPLTKDDAELEAIWKSEHSLAEIIDAKQFKTYDQLKARLNDVLGVGGTTTTTLATATVKKTVVEDDVPFENSKSIATKKAPVVEEEDEDLAMFRELAELDD